MIIILRFMKNVAIILAGGIGSRMNNKTPKQFLKLNGKEIIIYSLETFSSCKRIDNIIVVSHENYLNKCKFLIKKYDIGKVISIVKGGNSRQDSVLNGLKEAKRLFKSCNVLIHDSARPLVTERIILENIRALKDNDCATTAIPVTDTVYNVNENLVIKGLDRKTIYLAQTPQCGKLNVIYDAYINAKEVFTDDASLLSSYGLKPFVVIGDIKNKKITTKLDLKNF